MNEYLASVMLFALVLVASGLCFLAFLWAMKRILYLIEDIQIWRRARSMK
jgi:uncharacterized protein HemY